MTGVLVLYCSACNGEGDLPGKALGPPGKKAIPPTGDDGCGGTTAIEGAHSSVDYLDALH